MFAFLRAALSIWVLFSVFALASPAASAALSQFGTPGITVQTVKLSAGRLVITGIASSIGRVVIIRGTAFRAIADSQKRFMFNVDYRTPDCRVYLATSTGWIGLAISDCGPAGIRNRGYWSATVAYAQNDLVSYTGSSWLARRANINRRPSLSTTATDWQLVARAGAQGRQGVAGAVGLTGPMGPQGPLGPQGPAGAIGPQGPQGPAGAMGPTGEQGPAGVAPRGEWSDGQRYDENDLVLFEGSTWRALVPNENVRPAAGSGEWQLFAARGLPGEAGGPPGPEGPAGPAGQTGPVGPAGPAGPAGTPGVRGDIGPMGPAGPPGPAGTPGATGPQGPIGAQGLAGPAGPAGAQGPAGPPGPMGESAGLVKRKKSCAASADYRRDQNNDAYCVVACELNEIGLFTFWEWIDVASGDRIAGYSSTMQMFTQTVPELQDRYGFAAFVGLNEYISTRRMNLFLFCAAR